MQDQWAPFQVIEGAITSPLRDVKSVAGRGDRMRAAAFAEFQAVIAFGWAADHFQDAPAELRAAWRALISEEQRHYDVIMKRMQELGIDPSERPVSLRLWRSLQGCDTAEKFARYMANSEERGRQAGLRFAREISVIDPATAQIFLKIAEEEVDHVALTARFFPAART